MTEVEEKLASVKAIAAAIGDKVPTGVLIFLPQETVYFKSRVCGFLARRLANLLE
jgi:hypothetical protein